MGRYFRGYYFKCCDGEKAVAFIPEAHGSGKSRGASVQVITEDRAYSVPYRGVRFGEGRLDIRAGKNRFYAGGMTVDICRPGCGIHGELRFGRLCRIKYGIMGPFGLVPFMQCRHEVVSMEHSVTGRLDINGRVYDFKDGRGYIEGDRGCSFPSEYIWTQSHFENGSLMLAVADIPVMGLHFKGIIGIVMLDGREYRIATYLGAKVEALGKNSVTVRQGKYRLRARLLAGEPRDSLRRGAQALKAPSGGRMARTIHESVSCRAYYCFSRDGKKLAEFVSENASFEYEIHGNNHGNNFRQQIF